MLIEHARPARLKPYRQLASLSFFLAGLLATAGPSAAATTAPPATPATTAPPAAAATAPTICSTSFDAYSVSSSVLSECGVQTYPLQATSALPGGGVLYTYNVAGTTVTVAKPPTGFSAMTATAAQLSEYNLPARPSDLTQLSLWDTTVGNAKPVSPPPFIAVLPNVKFANSLNWGGYVTTSNVNFYQAEMDWVEPSAGGSSCSGDESSFWTGLGGNYQGAPLAQAGSQMGEGWAGLANHQMWWEILPAGPKAVPLYAVPGTLSESEVTYTGSGFNFYLFANGQYWSSNESSASYDGSTADFIVEAPTYNGQITNLTNFGTLSVGGALANYNPIGSYTDISYTMTDSDNDYQRTLPPSPLSNGQYFTVTQHSCQYVS